MSRVVPVRGDRPVFPVNACVNCLQPAARTVEIVKVRGHSVRKVDVPLCEDCIALCQTKSRRQVLFERVAVINSLLLAVAVGLRVYSFLEKELQPVAGYGPSWGALLGALSALVVFGLMWLIVRPWSSRFRSPATKAAARSVIIRDFDWDTTVLEFANEEYAERFAQANAVPPESV